MKQTLLWAIVAAIVGLGLGAALAYVEVKPWQFDLAAGIDAPNDHSAHDHGTTPADSPAESTKQLEVKETQYEFGSMEIGTSQRHAFPISNTGSEPITVEFLTNTCQCTAVELNGLPAEGAGPVLLKPGESTTVELEWVAKGEPRSFRHGATFETNDPGKKRLEFHVVGELVDSTSLDPPLLHFGMVRVDKPAEASLWISSYLEPSVEILDYEILEPNVAELVDIKFDAGTPLNLPDPKAMAGLRVVASFRPGKSLGPFHGTLKMKTNLKRASQLTVPISGNVVGDISVFGPGWNRTRGLLKLPPIDSKKGGQVKLTVAIRGNHQASGPVEIASTSPQVLEAELGEPVEMSPELLHVPLIVSIPRGSRPMARLGGDLGAEGEIVLKTGHTVTPEFKLRVAFIVQ
ncbi:DUF1573 domain-containing protein [Adhaeretor mobilis]|uniref:DUF1573 domain-containing protein n=1 Tax=Adhaeretor mobilis TaxID=1930276 RepID=A0A517MZZ8_9BACT|nr:DUF1573 domain-containing protein [Adhaeretor mobilis]QDT00445.1 hypothetical protein HG15A2_37830 [Adhaeretor mobilis]